MSKKKKHGQGGGEHENSERWLLTYADMITLLVAFFIMLYAMSVVNVTKFEQLAISVRSGFGSNLNNGVPTVFSKGGGSSSTAAIMSNARSVQATKNDKFPASGHNTKPNAKSLDKAYEAMVKFIKEKHLENKVAVDRNERGVVITILTDHMLFSSGRADLNPGEFPLLNMLASVMNTDDITNHVRVEGHTDSLPIHTARFLDNWDLSSARATNVLRYLLRHGVTDTRLEAAGYADTHPIARNDSDENRARNRRVEIVLLKLPGDDQIKRMFNPMS